MKLGEVRQTERGFEVIEFKDRYGNDCSLQQSSLYTSDDVEPGASALWLGVEDERMHLDRPRVAALIKELKGWLKTGHLGASGG